jgi:hypothetical protein
MLGKELRHQITPDKISVLKSTKKGMIRELKRIINMPNISKEYKVSLTRQTVSEIKIINRELNLEESDGIEKWV